MSSVPMRWRQGGAPAGRSRRALVALLLAGLALAVIGLFLALPYLRPPAQVRFAALLVNGHRDPALTPMGWRKQDLDGLGELGLFRSVVEAPAITDTATLLKHLGSLPASREGIVVYLASPARLDRSGQVNLLPSDADLDDATTWLPLRRVLELLKGARTRHLLLILDLEAPTGDPKSGIVLDDLASAIPAELDAVPDARRLVLVSGESGQRAWTSETMERSAFGHYLEEGLRGSADASGDGRVSAKELGAFVRARVDRWSRKCRASRQTPVLLGEGGDFTLVDLPNGQALPSRELPEETTYPETLLAAWKKVGDVPERKLALVEAERAWRDGADEERIAALAGQALRISARQTASAPPVRSLARAVNGRPPEKEHLDDLRRLVFVTEQKSRGLPEAKAVEFRTQQVADYLKKFTKPPDTAAVCWAALEVAIGDPRPETVTLLASVVRAVEAEPAHVETLLFLQIAQGSHSREVNGKALEAIRSVELALRSPRVFALARMESASAAQFAHEGLTLLGSPGYAPQPRGVDELTQALTGARTALAKQAAVAEALAVLDRARAWLPLALRAVARSGRDEAGWLESARLTRELADVLDQQRPSLDDIARRSAELAQKLTALEDPYTDSGRTALLRSARRGTANAATWRDLDALLATPFVEGAERAEAWKVLTNLSRRLEDEVLRLDRIEGTRLEEVTLANVEPLTAALASAKRSAALVQLSPLSDAERETLTRAIPDQPDLEKLFAFAVQLRRAVKSLPTVPRADDRLWAYLADRHRYQARESAVLKHDAAATFHRRAAQEFAPWLSEVREEYVDVSEANEPPRLLPDRPITQEVEIRPVSRQDRPAMKVDVLSPGEGAWLKVAPQSLTLPGAPRVRVSDKGTIVPLRIALADESGRGQTAIPSGVMMRIRLGERSYHRPIEIPLTARGPEIVLATGDKPVSPGLPAVRLRAGTGKATYKLFLTNTTDKGWKKLVVKMRFGDEERTSAEFDLAGRASKAVAFPAGKVNVVGVSPTPGTAPTATPPLPRLNGPIQISVLSREDRDQVINQRTIPVDLARPEEYVSVTEARFDPAEGKNRLAVKLRLRHSLGAPPVSATLAFAPAIEGGAVAGAGTLQAKLPDNRDEITLFAENVQPPDGTNEGRFALHIDGWERAFLFRASLGARGSAATPRSIETSGIRLDVGAYALAGTEFRVPLKVDNAPPGSSIVVSLGRTEQGRFVAEATARRPTARDRYLGFDPSGPEGALVFEGTWRDWVLPLDTARIRGPRQLFAWLVDANGKTLVTAVQMVTLGDRKPDGVAFIAPPAQSWMKAPLTVKARGGDSVVGVKEVFFFYGKPANEKVPEGAIKVAATATDDAKKEWAAKMPAANKPGPIDVSVQFVNQVGLSTFATISVDMVENDPAASKPAKIKGTVSEGDRGQAGIEVVLTDDKNAEKARTKSKADGAYEFADLAPGKYRVSATKPANGRNGSYPKTGFIELKAGATADAPIVLFLRN